jgi:cytochrome c peroxidase
MRRYKSIAIKLVVAVLAAVPLVNSFAGDLSVRATHLRDRWSAAELGVLASLQLNQLPPDPKDPSNAVEMSPAAVEFGEHLFNDARFSRNGAVSCATCHDPKKQFQDGLPVGRGVGIGSRRAMPIVGAGHSPWLFWDGRKDSLWSQALGPLEDSVEHGGNRTRYAQLIGEHYRSEYEAVFGTMPDLGRLPGDAAPNGTETERAAWQAMEEHKRENVSRVFANMGKAIAAYEKSLHHEASRLDRYVEGVVTGNPAGVEALNPDEVKGLRLFIGKAQCVTCHNGPLLSDQHFHNTGVPARDSGKPDRGRAAATAKVANDEFNCLGRFSDAKPQQCQELRFMVSDDPSLEGAFKTPSLRDVALRPPYMHAGQFATLEEVVRHYVKAPHAAVGHSELTHLHADSPQPGHAERPPIVLSETEIKDLVSFLGALSGLTPDFTQASRPPLVSSESSVASASASTQPGSPASRATAR